MIPSAKPKNEALYMCNRKCKFQVKIQFLIQLQHKLNKEEIDSTALISQKGIQLMKNTL